MIWLEVLEDLTPKALETGMKRLMKMNTDDKFCEYPPNALQFRSLCLSGGGVLPNAHKAFREFESNRHLSRPRYSHPAVGYTINMLGASFQTIACPQQTFRVFEKAYTKVCHLVKQGHELPKSSVPKHLKTIAIRESGMAHLYNIKKMIGAQL